MRYIQQHDETDCAAACIAMILTHYKSSILLSTIREYAGTDKNGTNVNGIIVAAEKLGFKAKAMRGTVEHLTSFLPGRKIAIFKDSHIYIDILFGDEKK